jgi:hypothetical protein
MPPASPDGDDKTAGAVASGRPAPEAGSAAAGIAGVERAFLRLTFWQTLLSLVGVFVGAVALYAALSESRAVRQQTAASVWPYLQLNLSDHESPDAAHFELLFSNVGVGPARMQGMLLEVDGAPVKSWSSLVDGFVETKGEEVSTTPDYGRSFITNRVIAPGESVSVFNTHDRALVRALRRGVYSARAAISYCYCSIFDDCWLQQSQSPTTRPIPVASCPDYGDRGFID